MVISITSLKGGVGKSTITQNLAVVFSHAGLKTVIVDADANQSSLRWSGERSEDLKAIPVYGLPDSDSILTANINKLKEVYDLVLIDGTPSLSRNTSRILMAANFVLIPIQPSQMDLWATERFVDHYVSAMEQKGSHIPASFLINRYRKSTIATQIPELLEESGINVFENKINDRIAYNKAAMEGKGVYEMKDEKSKQEIIRVYDELNAELNNILSK